MPGEEERGSGMLLSCSTQFRVKRLQCFPEGEGHQCVCLAGRGPRQVVLPQTIEGLGVRGPAGVGRYGQGGGWQVKG